MRRRSFFKAATLGPLLLKAQTLFAQSFDLIIRGGRVIDPSLNLDTIADVGIANGRIESIDRELNASATDEINATNKIVLPGLLDIHAHDAQDDRGAHICLSDSVTGWVDAGSAGADNIEEMVAVARSAPQPARILLNIGRGGGHPRGGYSRYFNGECRSCQSSDC